MNIDQFLQDFIAPINRKQATAMLHEIVDGYYDNGVADGEANVDNSEAYERGYTDGVADGEANFDDSEEYERGYTDGVVDGKTNFDDSEEYERGYNDGLNYNMNSKE